LKISPSKSTIVVAPGCKVGVIKELLEARILPPHGEVDILLPPESSDCYNFFTDRNTPADRVRFLSSPARNFFSMSHLKWLLGNVRSCDDNKLLVSQSPYKDFKTALASILILFLSGRTITLLFSTPEAMITTDGQDFSDKWISQELNLAILAKEFNRILWFLLPMFLLYLFMFWSLIAKKRLGRAISPLIRSS
jgi:hypothetical protein